MRKILSWDVGIKHLAFCIINETPTGFTIENWQNIDLTDSNLQVCCGLLKKKKKTDKEEICNAHAKFFVKNKYYCGTHKSQYIIDLDLLEKEHITIYNNPNKELCMYTSTKAKSNCTKKADFVFDNIQCCKNHKDIQLKATVKDLSLKPIKNKSCTDTSPEILCEKMYNKLSELDFKDITHVYIENQPDKNNTMRGVSSMLLSYFVFLSKSQNVKMNIKFVSASIKIKFDDSLLNYTTDYISNHNKIKKTDCKCRICKMDIELNRNKQDFNNDLSKYKFNYDSTKELGIIYTQKILKDNNMIDHITFINGYNKKDDLCDAFLHGYKKL